MTIIIALSTVDRILANVTTHNDIIAKLTLFTFINWKGRIQTVTFVFVRSWVEISSDITSLTVCLWAWLATWVLYVTWNACIKWVQACWRAACALGCRDVTCFTWWWAVVTLTVWLIFAIPTATESCKCFRCAFVKIHLISISGHSCVFQLRCWSLIENQFEFRTCFEILIFVIIW